MGGGGRSPDTNIHLAQPKPWPLVNIWDMLYLPVPTKGKVPILPLLYTLELYLTYSSLYQVQAKDSSKQETQALPPRSPNPSGNPTLAG